MYIYIYMYTSKTRLFAICIAAELLRHAMMQNKTLTYSEYILFMNKKWMNFLLYVPCVLQFWFGGRLIFCLWSLPPPPLVLLLRVSLMRWYILSLNTNPLKCFPWLSVIKFKHPIHKFRFWIHVNMKWSKFETPHLIQRFRPRYSGILLGILGSGISVEEFRTHSDILTYLDYF